MKKTGCLSMLLLTACMVDLSALDLVRNGKAVSEIVVDSNACNSTRTAALELQKYVKKMSGAELAIVPAKGKLPPIYIGKSKATEQLGITTEDIKADGFKILVTDSCAAVVGVDNNRPPIPRCNTTFQQLIDGKSLAEWQKFTGRPWGLHLIHIRDPRDARFKDFNQPLSFHRKDATGTLYGVYDLLETLGCRFFLPIEEIGFVIPAQKTITLPKMNRKSEPSFEVRELASCFPKNDAEFLWRKQLRQGGTYDMQVQHSSSDIVQFQQNRPEMIQHNNGKMSFSSPRHPLPRLASPELRKEQAEHILKMKEAYPELRQFQISQPDGWIRLDDRDRAAGWDKLAAEGPWGRFSDYLWDFVLDVAKRVRAKQPGLSFSTYSYGNCKLPPKSIGRIPGDIGIVFTQSSPLWNQAEKQGELPLRREWEKKAPDSSFILYDYYLSHSPQRNTPAVPAIFTRSLEQNLKSTSDRYRGVFVEISAGAGKNAPLQMKFPGVNHLMYYLHGKLTWDKNADVPALLKDYYEKFFGPAAAEMKEFYEFAESVWMRPASRQITRYSGFLKPADVERYFDLLKRAKAKAGDTIYGKRIDFIAAEMEPLKKVFVNMERTGPYVRVRAIPKAQNFIVDGNLEKEIWTGQHAGERLQMKDNLTGERLSVNGTQTAFRWVNNSLLIGITCFERRMNRIAKSAAKENDDAIWSDDNIELLLETPEGYNLKLAVNPNGSVWCWGITPDVTDVASAWRPAAVAVKQYPDRWTVEIQLRGIGAMPTKSIPWGINVCRQRKAEGRTELSAISPTGGKFQNPNRMANLWSDGR